MQILPVGPVLAMILHAFVSSYIPPFNFFEKIVQHRSSSPCGKFGKVAKDAEEVLNLLRPNNGQKRPKNGQKTAKKRPQTAKNSQKTEYACKLSNQHTKHITLTDETTCKQIHKKKIANKPQHRHTYTHGLTLGTRPAACTGLNKSPHNSFKNVNYGKKVSRGRTLRIRNI